MIKRTKKQHYLSRHYLENFSTATKKKDLLWVYDSKENNWRPSRPEKEGCENDFQTIIDEKNNKHDDLEVFLGPLEENFKWIIKKIEEEHCVPKNNEDFETLLLIMGLFAIRIPDVRDQLTSFASEMSIKSLGLTLKDENTYLGRIKKAQRSVFSVETEM